MLISWTGNQPPNNLLEVAGLMAEVAQLQNTEQGKFTCNTALNII
jgi:hypothetical protein